MKRVSKGFRRRVQMELLNAHQGFKEGFVEGISLAWALVTRPPMAALRSIQDISRRFLRHEPLTPSSWTSRSKP